MLQNLILHQYMTNNNCKNRSKYKHLIKAKDLQKHTVFLQKTNNVPCGTLINNNTKH